MKNKGFLIAIEGTDGSGKHLQSELLSKGLEQAGEQVRLLSFPCYDSPSSALVKMYLGGDFGRDPGKVNPYAASSFYAVDRVASYMSDWKADYDAGKILVADRYAESNRQKYARRQSRALPLYGADYDGPPSRKSSSRLQTHHPTHAPKQPPPGLPSNLLTANGRSLVSHEARKILRWFVHHHGALCP